MRLTRREYTRLVGVCLGVSAAGLPNLTRGADAAGLGLPVLDLKLPLHPLLQYGANKEPDKPITVIVQKASLLGRVANIANACGGQVLEEFPFIKSFAMRVQQGHLLKLLRRLDVLYISPDVALQRQAAIGTDTPETTHPVTATADQVWRNASYSSTGGGATVAVIDTGLTPSADFAGGSSPSISTRARRESSTGTATARTLPASSRGAGRTATTSASPRIAP